MENPSVKNEIFYTFFGYIKTCVDVTAFSILQNQLILTDLSHPFM